jgi:hypothetical protein
MKEFFLNLLVQTVRLIIISAILTFASIIVMVYIFPPSKRNEQIARPVPPAEKEKDPDENKLEEMDLCLACHEQRCGMIKQGKHKSMSCGDCHGPAGLHAANPAEKRAMVPKKRAYCLDCHGCDPSRAGAPRVDPGQHHPTELCTPCHNPHDPTIDVGPVAPNGPSIVSDP